MSGKRGQYTAYDRDQVAKWKAAIAASKRQQRQRRGRPKQQDVPGYRPGMARVTPRQGDRS